MNESYSEDDLDYIAGFEAGCNYIVAEIERYAKEYRGDKLPFAELLYHLKKGDGDSGKLLTKNFQKSVDKV